MKPLPEYPDPSHWPRRMFSIDCMDGKRFACPDEVPPDGWYDSPAEVIENLPDVSDEQEPQPEDNLTMVGKEERKKPGRPRRLK